MRIDGAATGGLLRNARDAMARLRAILRSTPWIRFATDAGSDFIPASAALPTPHDRLRSSATRRVRRAIA
jgi:hypothetical protein